MGGEARCPLLALSGHSFLHRACPLLGVKRTCLFALHMSAFDPKRTWNFTNLRLAHLGRQGHPINAMGVHIRRICATAGLIVFLAVSLGCPAGFAAESKRVMLLHSFGRDFKPWSEYAKTIRTELDRQSPWPLDIIEYSLVTARFSDENPEAPFVEYLRALFAKHPLDLIVSIGAPAANFVQRHRRRLFPTTPMMFTAVDQRRVQFSNLTENDTVVAVTHQLFVSLREHPASVAGHQRP